uniref:MHC class I-like antigen recognition-like domain-containing protein n=1 Tax=Vombatus ursinus TaxID=29139 RepID=A0A4X2KTI5_VOMUR
MSEIGTPNLCCSRAELEHGPRCLRAEHCSFGLLIRPLDRLQSPRSCGYLSSPESHRLQYNLFAMVSSDGEPPSYSAHGYLDDELFLHYDSESQRPEPRGTWLDGLVETDTWKKEKSNVKEIGQDFKITLRQIMDQSNLNTGSHTFQETLGCELHEDGTRRGFWKYGYDGRDFLILQPETLTWKAVHPAAGNLKNALEEEPREIKIKKAKTEGDCCDQLLSYLKFWQEKKAGTDVG